MIRPLFAQHRAGGSHAMPRFSIAAAILLPLLALVPESGAAQFGLFTYEVTGNEITITGYPDSAAGEVVIPSLIESKRVTAIGDSAFDYCSNVTSISIPRGVTRIGRSAFAGCSRVGGITIPLSVTTIEDWAFYGCSSMTRVVIEDHFNPRLTSIGYGAFSQCYSLDSINLPTSLTSIGGEAFGSCALTEITIPAGVGSIGFGTFQACSNLTRIRLPSHITSIGDWAFATCWRLADIEIPASVTSIGSYAFAYCDGLSSMIMPSNLTVVGENAFYSCTSLQAVVFEGDAPLLGDSVFDQAAAGFTLYYFSDHAGFTSPAWQGYPAVEMDRGIYPAASWLITHGLDYDTDLSVDLNDDGVSLLYAYALGLDPRDHLRGRLHSYAIMGNSFAMDYYAGRSGIVYRIETCTDPAQSDWVTSGITVTPLDVDNHRTASVPMDVPSRFMRLVIEWE